MKKLLFATAAALTLSGAGFSQMMGGMHEMMGGQGGMMGQPPSQPYQPYQPYYYYYYPSPYMMMPMMPMHDPRWMVENAIRYLIYNKSFVKEVLKKNPQLKKELKELLK